tara:strand:+ start:458 stop:1159 length:702 start_codon:yes stop_codon:yes gene_type:complete
MTWKDKAAKFASESQPNEICGLLALIKGKETFWPCKNLSNEPDEYFIIDPEDWANCEDQGELVGIVHSHPHGSALPSEADKASCEHLGLPFYIYSLEHNDWYCFEPSGYESGLFGRTWIWGKHDCWSLIVDYYKKHLNIDLGTCYRTKTLKEFAEKPYFDKILDDAGFVEIDKDNIKENDVLLMSSIEEKLNHVALYIGNQTIFHHNIKQLSCREIYDLNYIQATQKAFRYAA